MLRRSLLIAGAVLTALVLGAAGLGAWVLGTERGTGWLVGLAVSRAPAGLEIERVSGRLLDEVEIAGLSYRSANEQVDLERASIAIDVAALLRGELVVEDLAVTAVDYRRLGGGQAPAAGPARAAAPAPSLPVTLVLESGVVGRLSIEREPEPIVLERITLGGRYVDNRVEINRLETRFRGFALSGYGSVGLGDPIAADGTLSWSGRFRDRNVLGSVAVRGTLAELGVELELLDPFAASGRGTVRFAETPSFDLELAWTDLAVPGVEAGSSPSGTASVSGTLDRLEFGGAAALAIEGRNLDAEVTGNLAEGTLSLERLDLELAGAPGTDEPRVDATATLDLETLAFSADIAADELDPSLVVPEYPGRVDADGTLSGRLGPDFELATDGLVLAGEIRGRPFRATVAGRLRGLEELELERGELTLGENRLDARGRIGARLALELDGELVDLAELYPGLNGVARLALELSGTGSAPVVTGRVDADDLAYGEYAAAHASLAGRAGIYPDAEIEVDVAADGLKLDRLDAATLTGNVTGRLDAHRASLELRAEQWSAGLEASGNLVDRVWRGRLTSAALEQTLLGRWALAAPSAVSVGAGRIELEESCLVNAGERFCASVRHRGAPTDRIAVSASEFAIETLQPFLPETMRLSGTYGLEAELNDLSGTPQGSLALRGGVTEIVLDLGGGEAATTTIDEIAVDAALDDWQLDFGLSLDGRDTGRIDLTVTADDIRSRSSRVDGRLDAFWPDLGVVSLVSPEVGTVAGTVTARLELGGTVAQPELEGSAAWNDGSVEVPAWGVVIDGIEAEGTSADGTAVEFSGTGRVEGSELSLTGRTDLDPARGWPTRLRLSGDHVRLVQVADAEVFASPDLLVDVALPDVVVAGSVLIPEATISIDELPAQAVSPTADAVIHGTEETEPSLRPLQVSADLRVTLGDDVRYTGSNLQSRLTGDLALRYASGRPANATGSVTLTGTYEAYGQSLELDRGELLFAGPLENPNLDVRAVRRIGETTVGVQLSGPLQAPETRIFSEPAMSEADALSYLLFGRPLSSSEAEESATLRSAAIAMGLQQALPVVERIGDTLGLDEFSIETTDADAGALMAGKYLSPKLYVRYSYGLFNRIGGLLLRFRINDRFSLETRSGDEKSMDLLYTVEKD